MTVILFMFFSRTFYIFIILNHIDIIKTFDQYLNMFLKKISFSAFHTAYVPGNDYLQKSTNLKFFPFAPFELD